MLQLPRRGLISWSTALLLLEFLIEFYRTARHKIGPVDQTFFSVYTYADANGGKKCEATQISILYYLNQVMKLFY